MVKSNQQSWASRTLLGALLASQGALGIGAAPPSPPDRWAPAAADAIQSPTAAPPPSSVSPMIERFVRQRGQELTAALPTIAPSVSDPSAPRPTPPVSGDLSGLRAVQEIRPRLAQIGRESPPLPPSVAPGPRGPRPAGARPDPLATGLKFKPAPLDPADLRFPINLATALRLADARPLMVAAAQASVWVAEGRLTQAKLLWVPSLILGVDYIRHDGGGPDINKGVMTFPSVNFFYAGPGLSQYVNLTDAIFEPLAARQDLNSAHWDIQTAKNDVLFETAQAYFRVHQYRGMYAGALYAVAEGRELVKRIEQLSNEFVPKVEVERARNMLADLEQAAVMDRQNWRVYSARLTQVLRLDPRAVVDPLEHDHAQVTLIDPTRTLDDLMSVALTNRPELSSRTAMVGAAEYRVRREKSRPFLPIVQLNGFQSAGMLIQGGVFALGPNSSLNQWFGRSDPDVQIIWQLENFGFGNLARIKHQRGQQSKAIIDLRKAQDMVAADVTRAQADVQSAAARVAQAERALLTAIVTFNGHLEGLEQTRRLENILYLTFRPQEAVYSLEQLNVSFNEYFTTVAEYNMAQFELFHALGYPAQEVTSLRPPGDVIPVDTSRPGFLPPVMNGPPPATR